MSVLDKIDKLMNEDDYAKKMNKLRNLKDSKLDHLASQIAKDIATRINRETISIKSKVLYKNQYVLEEVIKKLNGMV